MGKVITLCLLVLLVSAVELRPSEFELVSEVITVTTEKFEVESSTEYTEVTTENVAEDFGEINTTGDRAAVETFTEYVEVTNTTGEATTEFIEDAIAADDANVTSAESEVKDSTNAAVETPDARHMTKRKLRTAARNVEVGIAEDTAVESTTDAAVDTTSDAVGTTMRKLMTSAGIVQEGTTEDAAVESTTDAAVETTSDAVDTTTWKLVTSAGNVEVATTEDAAVESTTDAAVETPDAPHMTARKLRTAARNVEVGIAEDAAVESTTDAAVDTTSDPVSTTMRKLMTSAGIVQEGTTEDAAVESTTDAAVETTGTSDAVDTTTWKLMTSEGNFEVGTTEDAAVETTTDAAVETSDAIDMTTMRLRTFAQNDQVAIAEDAVVESTDTTNFIDVTTTTQGLNQVASKENIHVTNTTNATVETTTEFVDVTTIQVTKLIFTDDIKVENTTEHAAETITDYLNVTSTSGIIKNSTERSELINSTGLFLVNSSDDVDHLRNYEPEPFVNSSVILPCFNANARRGITPFIARPYDFDAELAAWTKQNLPTKIAFMNNDDSIHFVDLTERLHTSSSGLTVKEYGDKVSLYLYTKHGKGGGVKLNLDVRQILKSGFNPIHPTKVIAHGFWSNTNSASVQKLINAYLKSGNYNVLVVDWSPLVYGFYSSAREEANGVGDYLGQFLRFLVYEKLVDPKRLHLIGHSLGAHLVGFAGKKAHQDGWGIRRITGERVESLGALLAGLERLKLQISLLRHGSQYPLKNGIYGSLNLVTGLDPAMPYFTLSDDTGRLDSSDADIVDVIHTCANFLGMTSFLGDIDFYPNEGTNFQPGCNLDVFGICSHGRAVEYFAESVSEPTAFVGKFCDYERSELLVKADNCPGEPIALMGEWLEFSEPGRYILRTAASPPYGLGLDILYPAYLYRRARNLPSNSTEIFRKLDS